MKRRNFLQWVGLGGLLAVIPAPLLRVVEKTGLKLRSKVVVVDASQGAVTITLPPAKLGVTYIIRKVDDTKNPVIVMTGSHRREIL